MWQFFRPVSWVLIALLPSLGLAQSTAKPNAAQQGLARIDALEEHVARLNLALQRVQTQPPEHFLLAALNLQSTLQTSRPYPREWQALRDAAPPGGLPTRFAEVLASHAVRGLATAIELRESFLVLAPILGAQVRADQSWLDRGREWLTRLIAAVGLAEAPPPSPAQATIANVSRLLARGQIAAALADLETLDDRLQPVITGWLAQARARVAAEQAVLETILSAFAARAAPP